MNCVCEWQAVPQNSLLPVTAMATWVPAVATKPMIRPTSNSANTDHRADGENNQVKNRRITPGLPESAIAYPWLLAKVVDHVVDHARLSSLTAITATLVLGHGSEPD